MSGNARALCSFLECALILVSTQGCYGTDGHVALLILCGRVCFAVKVVPLGNLGSTRRLCISPNIESDIRMVFMTCQVRSGCAILPPCENAYVDTVDLG